MRVSEEKLRKVILEGMAESHTFQFQKFPEVVADKIIKKLKGETRK